MGDSDNGSCSQTPSQEACFICLGLRGRRLQPHELVGESSSVRTSSSSSLNSNSNQVISSKICRLLRTPNMEKFIHPENKDLNQENLKYCFECTEDIKTYWDGMRDIRQIHMKKIFDFYNTKDMEVLKQTRCAKAIGQIDRSREFIKSELRKIKNQLNKNLENWTKTNSDSILHSEPEKLIGAAELVTDDQKSTSSQPILNDLEIENNDINEIDLTQEPKDVPVPFQLTKLTSNCDLTMDSSQNKLISENKANLNVHTKVDEKKNSCLKQTAVEIGTGDHKSTSSLPQPISVPEDYRNGEIGTGTKATQRPLNESMSLKSTSNYDLNLNTDESQKKNESNSQNKPNIIVIMCKKVSEKFYLKQIGVEIVAEVQESTSSLTEQIPISDDSRNKQVEIENNGGGELTLSQEPLDLDKSASLLSTTNFDLTSNPFHDESEFQDYINLISQKKAAHNSYAERIGMEIVAEEDRGNEDVEVEIGNNIDVIDLTEEPFDEIIGSTELTDLTSTLNCDSISGCSQIKLECENKTDLNAYTKKEESSGVEQTMTEIVVEDRKSTQPPSMSNHDRNRKADIENIAIDEIGLTKVLLDKSMYSKSTSNYDLNIDPSRKNESKTQHNTNIIINLHKNVSEKIYPEQIGLVEDQISTSISTKPISISDGCGNGDTEIENKAAQSMSISNDHQDDYLIESGNHIMDEVVSAMGLLNECIPFQLPYYWDTNRPHNESESLEVAGNSCVVQHEVEIVPVIEDEKSSSISTQPISMSANRSIGEMEIDLTQEPLDEYISFQVADSSDWNMDSFKIKSEYQDDAHFNVQEIFHNVDDIGGEVEIEDQIPAASSSQATSMSDDGCIETENNIVEKVVLITSPLDEAILFQPTSDCHWDVDTNPSKKESESQDDEVGQSRILTPTQKPNQLCKPISKSGNNSLKICEGRSRSFQNSTKLGSSFLPRKDPDYILTYEIQLDNERPLRKLKRLPVELNSTSEIKSPHKKRKTDYKFKETPIKNIKTVCGESCVKQNDVEIVAEASSSTLPISMSEDLKTGEMEIESDAASEIILIQEPLYDSFQLASNVDGKIVDDSPKTKSEVHDETNFNEHENSYYAEQFGAEIEFEDKKAAASSFQPTSMSGDSSIETESDTVEVVLGIVQLDDTIPIPVQLAFDCDWSIAPSKNESKSQDDKTGKSVELDTTQSQKPNQSCEPKSKPANDGVKTFKEKGHSFRNSIQGIISCLPKIPRRKSKQLSIELSPTSETQLPPKKRRTNYTETAVHTTETTDSCVEEIGTKVVTVTETNDQASASSSTQAIALPHLYRDRYSLRKQVPDFEVRIPTTREAIMEKEMLGDILQTLPKSQPVHENSEPRSILMTGERKNAPRVPKRFHFSQIVHFCDIEGNCGIEILKDKTPIPPSILITDDRRKSPRLTKCVRFTGIQDSDESSESDSDSGTKSDGTSDGSATPNNRQSYTIVKLR